MGSRATIDILNEKTTLCRIYLQFDGYPEGTPKRIRKYLKSIELVNGFSDHPPETTANGMGCLAAKLIAYLKNSNPLGNVYLVDPASSEPEYFHYVVRQCKYKAILHGPTGPSLDKLQDEVEE